MDGILLIDKPSGLTSHDVVDYVRKKAGIRKVGHTGTLDPNATGLLILCLGKATRLSEFFIALDKTYEGKMQLGVVSDSHDIDGKIIEEKDIGNISKRKIKKYASEFIGEIEQVPPMISAIKIGGKRLYKMARQGETIEREPRRVKIYEFEISKIEIPYLWFHVSCSRGTYVRTLCHDFGERLGCGAILTELKRTKVGNYTVNNAVPLESLKTKKDVQEHIISIEHALDLPQAVISSLGEKMFMHGNKIKKEDLLELQKGTSELVQVFNKQGNFLGIASIVKTALGPNLLPKKVFN